MKADEIKLIVVAACLCIAIGLVALMLNASKHGAQVADMIPHVIGFAVSVGGAILTFASIDL